MYKKVQLNPSYAAKTKALMPDGSFMQVESISEFSPWSI